MTFEFDDLDDWGHLRFHLLEGEAHAVTQRHLAEVTGIGLRRVQTALEAAKRVGQPIVTGSAGVWLSYDVEELRDAYRRDRNRAIRQLVNNRGRLKAIAAISRAKEQVVQPTLWEAA